MMKSDKSNHIQFEASNPDLKFNGVTQWNRFLCLITKELRKARPVATPEEYGWYIERTRYWGLPYELPVAWFVTNGCFADRSGSCTMCNFGAGEGVTPEDMLWQIDRILEKVSELPMIYITPLGSMFDDAEVPPDVRQTIFRRIAKSGCKIYGTESRPDTISDEKIAQFRDVFGPKVILQVGLGVETADPYIRRNCINKGLSQNDSINALKTLKKYNVQALVHILLKPPFLTEAEAINDALNTVEWAFNHGADGIVFCMSNLKPHTLSFWLQQRDRYRVPYVWSGLSVLRSMEHEFRKLCTISGLYSGVSIYQNAYNCPNCTSQIISGLQRFSTRPDIEILDELDKFPCSCRDQWDDLVKQRCTQKLPLRLQKEYEKIAREIFGDAWWEEASEWVLNDLENCNILMT